MKRFITFCLLVILVFTPTFYIYFKTGTVTRFENDNIVIQDEDNNVWRIIDDCYNTHDKIGIVFNNNGTIEIEDDIILQTFLIK